MEEFEGGTRRDERESGGGGIGGRRRRIDRFLQAQSTMSGDVWAKSVEEKWGHTMSTQCKIPNTVGTL